jgi:hypothetical protein
VDSGPDAGRAAAVVGRLGSVAVGFLDKAKDLLAQNADKVETAIDKAGEFVDEKTQGKYTDTIHQVQEQAKKATGGDQQ